VSNKCISVILSLRTDTLFSVIYLLLADASVVSAVWRLEDKLQRGGNIFS